MATIATVPNEVPGNFNTAALFNLMGGITNYLLAPVRFKGYAATAQTIANGTTGIPLLLDTELWDSDGGHSTVTNTSRYTAQTAGLYYVSGFVCIGPTAGSSVGTRTLQIFLNGVGVIGSAVQSAPSPANGTSVFTATTVQMVVGDYVELAFWQNTTVSLTTSTSNAIVTTMNLYRVSS